MTGIDSAFLSPENQNVTDIDRLYADLEVSARRLGLASRTLGLVGGYPILLLTREADTKLPRGLVAGGFHGDEPAGPWGIARFLRETDTSVFKQTALSFLPLINPTGLRAGTHCNDWDENPNRFFIHTQGPDKTPSHEGAVLTQYLPLLLRAARDGFISLHEDSGMEAFYAYTFEQGGKPGVFTEKLLSAGTAHFPLQKDGPLYPPEPDTVQNGVVFNLHDGTFEDLLFDSGVPRTACTETPGKRPIGDRVATAQGIIETFAQLLAEG